MKKIYICLVAVLAVQLIHANTCTAQTTTLNLKPAPANVIIDGSLKEWGDSLTYYNPETQVNYTIANDKDNLYLVLKTNDPVQQAKILNWGITFSVDTKGRKKSSYSVVFPVQEQDAEHFGGGAEQDKKLEASLTKLKKLKVDGFKDVEYDLITLENTYGFKIAINYDDHGFLVYEEAIPMALFHADDLKKAEWAFNIKINGKQKVIKDDTDGQEKTAATGGGRGHRGGGMGGGRGGHSRVGAADDETDPGGITKSVDFWGKFYLAK